jgi:hypothetical protein
MKTNSIRTIIVKNITNLFLIFSSYWIGNNTSYASATGGFDLQVDASTDSDGDTRWEDSVGSSGFEYLLDDSPAVNRVTNSSTYSLFTHAYDFPGGSTGNEAGALKVTSGTTQTRSFQHAPGDWTNEDVSIEIWFKPDNLTPTPTNGQILFEDGGGTGMGLFIDNNELRARKAGGDGNIAYNLSTDPSNLIDGNATADFIQAIVMYDVSAGSISLAVNGSLIGSHTPGGSDWSGSDAFAIGTLGGSNAGGIGGGQQNTESFDGKIALFRVYRNQILNADEIKSNYYAGIVKIAPVFTVNQITHTTPIPVSLTFKNGDTNTSVSNFVQGDLNVTGATISNFSGSGHTYTFNLTPSSDPSRISVKIAHDAASATSGNLPVAGVNQEIFFRKAISQESNLLLWYPLNDPSTSAVAKDWGPHHMNGVISGSPARVEGKVGSAIQFDGNDDKVVVPFDPVMLINQYTVSLWVRPETNDEAWTFLVGRETNGHRNYYMELSSSNHATSATLHHRFKMGNTGNDGLDGSAGVLMNNWNHLVISNPGNPGTAKTFINGVAIKTKTINNIIGMDLTSDFCIGVHPNSQNSSYFKGRIQDVRLYSAGFTDSQVLALYSSLSTDSGVPVISTQSPVSINSGTSISLAQTASIPKNGFALTWSASALPSGLSINPTTGAISGTPAANANPVSSTVMATNLYGTHYLPTMFLIHPLPSSVTVSSTTDLTLYGATLNGSFADSSGTAYTVNAFVDVADRGTTAGSWSKQFPINVTSTGPFTRTVVGLNPGTTYYYRFAVANAGGVKKWTSSAGTFTTLSAVAPPSLGSLSVSSLTTSGATLSGSLLNTGGENPSFSFLWGDEDRNSSVSLWDNQVSMGIVGSGTQSTNLTGLQLGKTYYFRIMASNGVSTVVSSEIGVFSPAYANITGFSPNTINTSSNLKLWLDASDLTTAAASWIDKSSFENNATKNGSPAIVTNVQNGLSVMRYAGNQADFHEFTDIADIRTVFWVLKKNSGDGFLLGDDNTNHFHANTGSIFHSASWMNSPFVRGGDLFVNGSLIVGTATDFPSSLSVLSLRTTGNVEASYFSRDRGNNKPWNGDLGELVIFNDLLSDDDMRKMEGYLAHKWGLTSGLPNNHAYKSSLIPPGITSATGASGSTSTAFTYQITTNLSGTPNYQAFNLVPGLSVDAGSGLISGTPLAGGVYNISLIAETGQDSVVGNLLLTIPVSAPLLSISPPTNIVANGAKLLGQVTQSGGADGNITVYWGDNDATTGSWDNSYTLGMKGNEALAHDVTSLSTGGTYYYRFKGDNLGNWSPVSLPKLLWLDASDSSSLTLESGKAKEWRDKSGNSHHSAQNNSNYRPALVTGALNGKQVLRFDGSNDRMHVGDIRTTTGDVHAFLVTQSSVTSGQNWQRLMGVYTSGNDWQAPNWKMDRPGNSGTPITYTGKIIEVSVQNRHISSLKIGSNGRGWSAASADIAEVLIFGTTLSSGEKSKIEGYLAHKWGITSTLANNHTYKNNQAQSGGTSWSSTQSFQTAITATAPILGSVFNASDITASSFKLNASLSSPGGTADTKLYFLWGDNDGNTTISSWDNNVTISNVNPGLISTEITSGFNPPTQYFARVVASNWKGHSWSTSTISFTPKSTNTTTPAQLFTSSKLKVWLDASDASTLWQNSGASSAASNGESLALWQDKSGNNNHASQSTSGDRPRVIANHLNSKTAIQFTQDNDVNGDDMELGSLSSQFPAGASWYAMVDLLESNVKRYNILGVNSANDDRMVAANWSESRPSSFLSYRANLSGWNNFPATGKAIFVYESDSSVFRISVNGTEIGTASAAYSSGSGVWQIGNRVGSGQAYNGYIAEIVMLNAVLPDATRKVMEGYLAHKWGASTSLPASHPYRASAPTSTSSITSPLTASASRGFTFTYQITANNSPTLYKIYNAPAWLSINQASGVVSGTPPAGGTFTFQVSAQGSASSAIGDLVLTVGDNTPFTNSLEISIQPFDLTRPTGDTVTSSAIESNRDATRLFDNLTLNGTGDRWEGANSALPAVWVQYQFAGGTRQKVTSYTLTAQNADVANRSPANWTLQGSNDGSTWTTLDTITGQTSWTAEEKRTYAISSPGSYEYYKLVISARAGSGGDRVALREMELLGTPSLSNWYMLVRLNESNSVSLRPRFSL